ATLKTLLKHAYACGIGNSMRVLTRQSKNLTHLLSVKAPDRLVRELAGYLDQNPQSMIQRCHLYPLGGLKKSVEWLGQVQQGQIRLGKTGFDVINALKA
ncbi:MAG: metFprotein, partial [Pseudomonadota bacterium]